MSDQLALLTPEESRPSAKVLKGRPLGPIGEPEPFTLRAQGEPKQARLVPEQASTKAPRKRSKQLRCYVGGCRVRSAERHTFTADPSGVALGRRWWKSVELCRRHADELTNEQKFEIAKCR